MEFYGEDSPHGIVNSLQRNVPIIDRLGQAINKGIIVVGHHNHIQPGIDGGNNITAIVAGYLINALPVGDEKALEVQFAFEHIGQQILLGMHFHASPTAKGDHDAHCASVYSRNVGGKMHSSQGGLIHIGDALVKHELLHDKGVRAAPGGSTISHKVFGCGQHRGGGTQIRG
ncbi:hypothetical protein ES708_22552 [subsurface metagenome]